MSDSAGLPEGWAWKTLGEVCQSPEYGWTTRASATGTVKFLRTTDISAGLLKWHAVPYCDETPPQLERFILADGDIVISRAGSVGLSALIRNCPVTVFASYLIRFRPSVEMHPEFVAAQLQTRNYWRAIADRAAGIALQNVNAKKLASIPIVVAPLAEQRRIVAAIEEQFTRLDAAVASLKRARANLKRYRAAVLTNAIQGQLTSVQVGRRLSNYSGKKSQNTTKRPSNSFEIPPSWVWVTVSQVGKVQLGRQRSPKNRSDKYPTKYLRAANITWWGLDLSDVLEMEFRPNELETYRLHPGDILLSEASGSAGEVGKPALWNGEIANCCFQNTVIRFRPARINPRYALLVFRTQAITGTFASVARGVGIHHLGAERFSKIAVPLPPEEEQRVIVLDVERRLSAVEVMEASIQANLKRAERLRQAILKRAFEGKLVPQDPTDEPASVLLERIRVERAAHNGSAPRRGRRNGKQHSGIPAQEALPL